MGRYGLPVLVSLASFGCGVDPALSVNGCPPPPEEHPVGPSSLTATGPCAFEQRAAVTCESSVDNFTLALTRKAKNGATLVMYVDFDHYHGPGNYDDGRMFVAVQDGQSLYRWSNDRARITVGPDEAFAVLPETRLAAEPMFVDCKRVIGSDTMYQHDCARQTSAKTPAEGTIEVVSGKLQCEGGTKGKGTS
jgi:hypothetical protein